MSPIGTHHSRNRGSDENSTARTISRDSGARFRAPTRKQLTRTFAALTALVAFLVGVASLVEFIERKLDSPAPPEIGASVRGVDLTTMREPYGRYLRGTSQSFPGVTKEDRREPGLVFVARVRFKGSEGERFLLRSSVFRSATKRPVPGWAFDQGEFTPRGQTHGREWQFWIPYPPKPGTFFTRATLLDAKGQPVDEQDSKPFRVKQVPPLSG